MKLVIGSDHGGYTMKQEVIEHLKSRGFEIIDVGTDSPASCDYPVYAKKLTDITRLHQLGWHHKIEINEALLDDSVPDLSLKRTIIHELCHTVKDGHGHRKGWREAADRLEEVYGLHLSPENSAEDLWVPSSLSQVPAVRYVFRCADCGLVIERYRRSKFVDNPEKYRCGNCGGTFEQL